MKLLSKNFKEGSVKLQIMSKDDLWYLSQLCDQGDIVKGRTERKVKLGTSEDRKSTAVKKTIFLSITVEKVEFHKYSGSLRIAGKVNEANEDVPAGSYHTFDVEEGTVLTLIKEKWLGYQLERLSEAAKPAQPKIMLIIFDREEVYFALLTAYGHEMLTEFKTDVEKKAMPEKVKSTFYKDIAQKAAEYDAKYGLNKIILASPAFWKEYLLKELPENLRGKSLLATCNSVGMQAISEVLSRPEVATALKDDRIVKESNLVDELLCEIKKEGKAAYGQRMVQDAAMAGAISRLLLADSLIQSTREDGSYPKIEYILKTVDSAKGEITIVSSDHDAGKKLSGIGGIAALLRYKL
jgi:protein pelota